MAKEKDMFDYDEIMKHIQQVNEQTQSAMDDMFKRSEEIAKKADAEAKEKEEREKAKEEKQREAEQQTAEQQAAGRAASGGNPGADAWAGRPCADGVLRRADASGKWRGRYPNTLP